MDSGAEYINVTFRGMELAFNIAGKPLGAALRAIKLIISGIAHSAKEGIDYAVDKNGIRSAAELRKLQYKRAKPISGEVAINEITDRYGADFALLQLPLANDSNAFADFKENVKDKGLCFAVAKDFNAEDGVIQIVVPGEQKVSYQAFFDVLNQELMPELDRKIKDYMIKINEIESSRNEILAKVKFLMQQRIKEDVSEEDKIKIVNDINKYNDMLQGIDRELKYIEKLKKTAEFSKYVEIDPDTYAASASGKSAEAYSRDGEIATLECASIEDWTKRGFEYENFDDSTDYLMNVGCSDLYMERKKYINSNGAKEYAYTLCDKGVKVEGAELKVNLYTSNEEIDEFNRKIESLVHAKNVQLSENNSYVPDAQDCKIYERIDNIDILSKKLENFEHYVKTESKKTPSSVKFNEEVEDALIKKAQSDEYKKAVNIRATGIHVMVPISQIKVENEYIRVSNADDEYMDIPQHEAIFDEKRIGDDIELIVAEPDKIRQVYRKDSKAVSSDMAFSKFASTYAERFKEMHKDTKDIARNIEEVGKNFKRS